jgi:hypothetical protein
LTAVQAFINRFDTGEDTFIYRAITMAEDVINSEDPDYVMSQIRKNHLSDSTVTMVLVGQCTWARKFVDWEIQASLRLPANGKPNGLLAVMLDGSKSAAALPNRLKLNVDSGYATFWAYPSSGASLATWIEDAYQARTLRARLIVNPRDRRKYNGSCP